MAEGEEGNTLTYDEFFVKAGSIGESCITAHGTANLSGDPLMVSENGVYGIVLSGNVATDERYARERSRSVNTELLKHDLSDACGIAYKNRYYLAVDGECFVADARYKYTLDADMDDTYNYEWFHYKNIPARCGTYWTESCGSGQIPAACTAWTAAAGQIYPGRGRRPARTAP